MEVATIKLLSDRIFFYIICKIHLLKVLEIGYKQMVQDFI